MARKKTTDKSLADKSIKGGEKGRPKIDIPWDSVAEMCKISCTEEEIASICKINIATLYRRCKEEYGITFAEFYKQNSAGGKMSVRRAQYNLAVNKENPAMLIWLGKNLLKQKDKSDEEIDAEKSKISIQFVDAIDDKSKDTTD